MTHSPNLTLGISVFKPPDEINGLDELLMCELFRV